MGTGYRPPSREPKGRWARHIHARRREEGWSQTRGFELVQKAGLGLGEKSRSAYIALDMGDREPTPAEEPALLSVYGPPPDTETESDATQQGDVALIAAIDRQTQAIVDLAALIREGVDRQAGAFDGLADGMMQLLSQLVSFHADNVDAPARRRVGSQ